MTDVIQETGCPICSCPSYEIILRSQVRTIVSCLGCLKRYVLPLEGPEPHHNID